MKIIRSKFFKYIAVSILFLVWICFFDDYKLGKRRELNTQLKELQNEFQETKKMIEEYKSQNNMLANNPEIIETIGRNNYYMKRDDEDIYILLKEDETGKLISLE